MRDVAHFKQADVGNDSEGSLDERQTASHQKSGSETPRGSLAGFREESTVRPVDVQRLAVEDAHSTINNEERDPGDESGFDQR